MVILRATLILGGQKDDKNMICSITQLFLGELHKIPWTSMWFE